MRTYRNTKATKRDHECTNIVFCQAETIQQVRALFPLSSWQECEESEIKTRNTDQLYLQAGVRVFGWL